MTFLISKEHNIYNDDITSTSPEPHVDDVAAHHRLVGPEINQRIFREMQFGRQMHWIVSLPHDTQIWCVVFPWNKSNDHDTIENN